MAQQQEEERYEIKGKVGEGGRGAVYRAYDRQLNRTVAIKRLFSEARDGEESEDSDKALIKESHALSAINSPHIVRVFDIARDEDGPYVVMEFLDGKTLHEVVSRAPLVLEDFLTIAEQGLEALIAAHDAKLLHRDIKPGNLMLTWLPSGRLQLKLLDFGLAKFSEKPAVQTIGQKGLVLGSIYFMAPEQFGRTPLDFRTDLYSLGCVFYYALTGDFPFRGDNVTEVMASHLQATCDDLQPLRPDLSPALCRWVMRLLACDMDDRPADAHEALREFEIAKRATVPIPAEPVPSEPRLLTGTDVEPATQSVDPLPSAASAPAPSVLTATVQVPLHTTTVVVDPRAHLSKSKGTTVPPWVFILCGTLLLSIVALGVAMATRGDPGKVKPPVPAVAEDVEKAPPGPTPPKPRSRGKNPKPAVTPPTNPPLPPPRKRWDAAAEFKKKDMDGDFVLSRAEFVYAKKNPKKAELEKTFTQLDKNRDGSLTMSEFKNRGGDKK